MTNKNIDKLPQTYIVSYYDYEMGQNVSLTQEQLSKITNPAKN
jgi:hypothetical protein